MPKSRKRKHGKRSTTPQGGSAARSNQFREKLDPYVAQEAMSAVLAADRAELVGDAISALRIIREVTLDLGNGPFWRPERLRRLEQIVELGPTLPDWARSRWIQAQALQHVCPATREIGRRARDISVEARGGLSVLPGKGELDALCRLMDHDWLFRQSFLFELGGLEHFLGEAPADLLAGAASIRVWRDAPMGGYRLVSEAPRSLVWEDLATGLATSVTNLGSSALVAQGECVIGRVVPLEIVGEMFEAAPLRVPEEVARAVADRPEDWRKALAIGFREHGVVPTRALRRPNGNEIVVSGLHDFGLLSDVPWNLVKMFADDFDQLVETSGAGRETIAALGSDRVAAGVKVCLLGRTFALRGPELAPAGLWPAVGAALTEPGVVRALGPATRPDYDEEWLALARYLAEPAGDILLELGGYGWGVA